jgi:CRP-like cAMP-binding protein
VELDVRAGRALCTQGGTQRQAFVLLAGTALVLTGGQPSSSLGPGDLVGEVALVDGRLSPETVLALTDLVVLVLSPADFAVMFDEPGLASLLARTLAYRVPSARTARVAPVPQFA